MTIWKVKEWLRDYQAEEWLNELAQQFSDLTVHSVVVSHHWEQGVSVEPWLIYTVSYKS